LTGEDLVPENILLPRRAADAEVRAKQAILNYFILHFFPLELTVSNCHVIDLRPRFFVSRKIMILSYTFKALQTTRRRNLILSHTDWNSKRRISSVSLGTLLNLQV
jgi:hypothetical protein